MEYQIPERMAKVERAISEASGISITDIRSSKRNPEFAWPRHAVWCIANRYLGYSFMAIARAYKKDHTTVMHGVARIKNSGHEGNIMAGLMKKCPEVFRGAKESEKASIENWNFD